MPPLRVTLHVDDDDVERVQARLRRLPKSAAGRLLEVAKDILQRMQVPGQKPTYPIQWASDLQRVAFYASDGFTLPPGISRPKGYKNKNIPRQRTNEYINGWAIDKYSETGYMVYNPSPQATFISGDINGQGQAKVNQGRWRLFATQVRYAVNRLPQLLRAAVQEFIDNARD